MAYRRRRLFRLDQLVIGANPEKLKNREIPAASVPAPLNDAERNRLSALTTKRTYSGPLSPAETHQREELRLRRMERVAAAGVSVSGAAIGLIIASGFYAMTNLPFADLVRGWWL